MDNVLRFPLLLEEPMVDEWADYLAAQGRAATTIKTRRAAVKLLGDMFPLETLTRKQVLKFIGSIATLKPETRKSYIVAIQQFCKWAKREGYYPKNPAKDIERPHIPKAFSRPCPDETFLNAMRKAPLRVQLMLALGRYAGLRLTEITTLHTDAMIGTGQLHIVGKGGKHRIVPVNAELSMLLHRVQLIQGPGYFFRSRFDKLEPMHPQSVEKIIKRALGMNPHSLRHAAATAAYETTHDLQAVQAFLGHSNLSTTERYLAMSKVRMEAVGEATRLDVVEIAA